MMSQGQCLKFVVEGLAIRKGDSARYIHDRAVKEINWSRSLTFRMKKCIQMFDLITLLDMRNCAAQEWPTL